jgi:hypothetical protein
LERRRKGKGVKSRVKTGAKKAGPGDLEDAANLAVCSGPDRSMVIRTQIPVFTLTSGQM